MDFTTGTPSQVGLDALVESLVNFLVDEVNAGRLVFVDGWLIPVEAVEEVKEAEIKSDPPK